MKVKKEKPQKAQQETTDAEVAAPVNPLKSVDSSIFKYFKDLTNDTESIRINAGIELLHHLAKSQDDEKRQKEISYCLKRLIRGAGASTLASRTGFFTTLVAFLQTTGDNVTIQQVLETIQKELPVGAAISNKEDADAVVGKILVCAAILRSGKLTQANIENLEQISNILIQASRHKTYHCSLAYSFLIEMIEQLTSNQFEESVWPLLHKELTKSWGKQIIQTVHCLIAVKRKFPSIVSGKFLKSHFGGSKLLNTESQPHLLRLFWENTSSDLLTHPALEAFGVYLATSSGLTEFWINYVDPCLEKPTKLQEVISLKICADVLAHLDTEKTSISELLAPNFITMIVTGLKNAKLKKDETLKAFYDEFFENLSSSCSKATDEERVGVIRKLILFPGTFNIEKFTSNRIVHQLIGFLGEKGVQEIFKTYKDIFLDHLAKNSENKMETWLNFERQNAAYMLQHLLSHKSVQSSFSWRREQLQFIMAIGLFNVNDNGEICARHEAGQLQKEFGTHMKNIFYASLQSKVPTLKDEKMILMSMMETCNGYLQKKNAAKYFRQKIDGKIVKAWNDMYTEIQKTKKAQGSEKKLQLVFQILLLHMGLQLFREAEMAETAILDLEKCMARTKDKKKTTGNLDSEPEWIEVVIDLFLHLLSQNACALRNIVNTVFPHLCDSLNLTAVHQILSMLDMKDGQNPLSGNGEDDEVEEEQEHSDEDELEKNQNGNAAEDSDGDETEESASEDDEDDEEVEDEDEDEDDEVTASDKLRNAISLALGSTMPKDDDQDSVDLNDMTEEEGRKLDEALSAAFKAMKKSDGANSQSKKSKSHRVQVTTVMHFRIRVLDLIEIYIQHEPSLLITIEIMLALFNMLEFCTDDEQKPLQIKVEKTLNKLTALRQFGSVQDVTEANLVDFIRIIIDKKSRSIAFDVQNRLKNKCCMFLIANAKLMSVGGANDQVLSLLTEYLEDFIKSRNPAVNITLLSDIFKLRWQGVWSLASTLAGKGISESTRTFRRIQVVELLTLVYKNHELIKQNEKLAKKHFKDVETILTQHLEIISKAPTISVKEFNTLLELFFTAHRCHAKLSIPSSILSACTDRVQEIRSKVKLDSAQSYHRFCNAYGVKPLKNAIQEQNGKENGNMSEDEQGEEETKSSNKAKKDSKKRKSSDTVDTSFKKGKKLKKEERMKAFSKGFNENFNFESSTPEDVVMSDGSPNESSSEDDSE